MSFMIYITYLDYYNTLTSYSYKLLVKTWERLTKYIKIKGKNSNILEFIVNTIKSLILYYHKIS